MDHQHVRHHHHAQDQLCGERRAQPQCLLPALEAAHLPAGAAPVPDQPSAALRARLPAAGRFLVAERCVTAAGRFFSCRCRCRCHRRYRTGAAADPLSAAQRRGAGTIGLTMAARAGRRHLAAAALLHLRLSAQWLLPTSAGAPAHGHQLAARALLEERCAGAHGGRAHAAAVRPALELSAAGRTRRCARQAHRRHGRVAGHALSGLAARTLRELCAVRPLPGRG
mmetsp:Transcript_18676/g.47467  ORF Transcript_18676/g.47467 Transcript_18676/m.47467 type:complete len:225 (-) Transcript_18676:1290-1964(-)